MHTEFEVIDTGTGTGLVRRDENGRIREIREPVRFAPLPTPPHAGAALAKTFKRARS